MENTQQAKVDHESVSRRSFLLMLAGAATVAGCGGGGGASQASKALVPGPDFFPLDVGDKWQWQTDRKSPTLPIATVLGPTNLNGTNVSQVDGPFFSDSSTFGDPINSNSNYRSYYVNNSSMLSSFGYNFGDAGGDWIYSPTNNIPWGLAVGASTTIARTLTNTFQGQVNVQQKSLVITRQSDQVVTTSAGTFNCAVYLFAETNIPTVHNPGIGTNQYTLYLAKAVGLVKYVALDVTEGYSANLTYAAVGSRTYGTLKG